MPESDRKRKSRSLSGFFEWQRGKWTGSLHTYMIRREPVDRETEFYEKVREVKDGYSDRGGYHSDYFICCGRQKLYV